MPVCFGHQQLENTVFKGQMRQESAKSRRKYETRYLLIIKIETYGKETSQNDEF